MRSQRTGDEGEDMVLSIIQKKEKGFAKKNTPKNREKYLETTGKENDASFSRDSPKKNAQLLNKE